LKQPNIFESAVVCEVFVAFRYCVDYGMLNMVMLAELDTNLCFISTNKQYVLVCMHANKRIGP